MEKKNSRFAEIDILKAIGIILVVIGHVFPDASSVNGISDPICRIIYLLIYSFHMPAFFFASGFVSLKYYKSLHDKKIGIIKKAKRLLIPYGVWACIYIPFRILLGRFSNEAFEYKNIWKVLIGDNPYSGLWFLYALFLISILFIIFVDSNLKLLIALSLSLVSLVVCDITNFVTIQPLKWVLLYSFYYFFGMLLRRNYDYFRSFLKNQNVFIILTLLFLASFIARQRLVNIIGVQITSITAFFGILSLLSLSILIGNNRNLEKIGSFSMDIFILSGPFLVALRIVLYNMLHFDYYFYCAAAIVFACFASYYISKLIIRRNKILSLLLLGASQ